MDYIDRYNSWLTDNNIDEDTKGELRKLDSVKDADEIKDRFYTDLQFGTGGMRGIMGAGTNRMNKYTIGKVTQGFANYLKNKFTAEILSSRGVVISFDVRNNSELFAGIVSNVLSSNGIKIYLFDHPVPTPELSFSVSFYNCIAGINITASHNPKEYNGYKIYDEIGCQLSLDDSKVLIEYINKINDFSEIALEGNKNLIERVDCTNEFVNEVLKQSLFHDELAKQKVKIVYTPIHGTGNIPVRSALKKDGFTNVLVVPEQELPNGNFPTASYPNPEDPKALTLAINLAKNVNADLVLASDPDSDRTAAVVRHQDDYQILSGNQLGTILVDYVCRKTKFDSDKKYALVKTIVTNELGEVIAKRHGVNVFTTLTGFKFIGQKIHEFYDAKQNHDSKRNYEFLIGYEESIGYLVGNHSKDKDAVATSMILSEMCAEYKSQNKTIIDRLNEIYSEYGYYKDFQDCYYFEGFSGIEKMQNVMNYFRNNTIFNEIKQVIDYLNNIKAEDGFGFIPKSNVLKFVFEDDSWIAMRPSGTEPKLKIYYSIIDKTAKEANEKFEKIRTIVLNTMKLFS